MRQLITAGLFLSLCLFATENLFAQSPDIDSLILQLKGENEDQQALAAHQLGELGSNAKSAVPALIQVVKTGSVASRSEAIIALGKIGPDSAAAVPELTKILRSYSIILKYNTLQALRQIGPASKPAIKQIVPLMESNNTYLNVAAARAVASIDPDNKENLKQAIKVLLDGLDVSMNEVRSDAATGLAEIGEPAVKPLLETLKKEHAADHHTECEKICDVIAQMGSQGESAIPTLLKIVKKVDDPNLVWRAAHALGTINASPKEVVPALTALLSNASPEVRANAAIALGEFGAAAKSAVPELTKLLSDSELSVKLDAAASLGDIGPDAASAVPQLASAMQAGPVALTLTSASALSSIGEASVPALNEMLAKDSPLKLLAVHVLGEIGASAKSSIPELVKLINSPDPDVSQTAITSLGEMGPAAIQVEPQLLDILKTSTGKTRNAAVYALSKIGSKKALPLIKQYASASDEDERFRLVCAWALVRDNPTDPETVKAALPGLIKVLSDENPLVRREAANAISLTGPLGEPAVAALTEALKKEENPRVTMELISALAEIGPKAAASAVPLITPYLSSGDRELRMIATYALARFGAASKSAIPSLEKELSAHNGMENTVTLWALAKIDPTPQRAQKAAPSMAKVITDHQNPDARLEAAISLGDFGINTPEIKQALEQGLKDKDPRVKKAAEAALKKLGS
ncbi:putative phycocyanin operon protein Z [Gimesia alba]|uniref:Putative phycocyanin operon protein Z n=1 Tax=Gimesia alba TaxID=2527973 RepID=A0A517RDS1_9PLAN|nr:HEAT repeat domain-containing protein [Gimesia alba]QDT42021.1 putative phycocyanin operon protein Z [Gimesia alba]